MANLSEVLKQFGTAVETVPFGSGHINETYVLNTQPRTILQRINTSVFKNPEHVMENIQAVTAHLRQKITQAGGDPMRETMTIVPTMDQKLCYRAPDGSVWRMFYFIEGAKTFDRADTPALFAASAHGFGKFQRMLADFPVDKLHEVIEKFHDTGNHLLRLRQAIAKNAAGRAESAQKEIDFILSRAHYTNIITDAIAGGSVPLRVTHNDTKLNNVMLDAETNKPVCVIDLDTVMPGSILYDFGDALRFGASTADEDEQDLSLVEFDLSYFEAFTKAYLEELGDTLTPRERDLLPLAPLILTLENAMRFLADHLDGDLYYRIHRPNHNLDRTRTHLKLVADMEQKMDRMIEIVRNF